LPNLRSVSAFAASVAGVVLLGYVIVVGISLLQPLVLSRVLFYPGDPATLHGSLTAVVRILIASHSISVGLGACLFLAFSLAFRGMRRAFRPGSKALARCLLGAATGSIGGALFYDTYTDALLGIQSIASTQWLALLLVLGLAGSVVVVITGAPREPDCENSSLGA
jgi:hypothetical protein